MNSLTRFYCLMFSAFVLAILFVNRTHAVEVSPDVNFQQSQSPNGSEYDPNGTYRARASSQKNTLNDKIFHDNHISKAMPNVNSVGLNFTFKIG